jgi:hypothetical protein
MFYDSKGTCPVMVFYNKTITKKRQINFKVKKTPRNKGNIKFYYSKSFPTKHTTRQMF